MENAHGFYVHDYFVFRTWWDLCPVCVFQHSVLLQGPRKGRMPSPFGVLHSQSTGSEQLGCPQC